MKICVWCQHKIIGEDHCCLNCATRISNRHEIGCTCRPCLIVRRDLTRQLREMAENGDLLPDHTGQRTGNKSQLDLMERALNSIYQQTEELLATIFMGEQDDPLREGVQRINNLAKEGLQQ